MKQVIIVDANVNLKKSKLLLNLSQILLIIIRDTTIPSTDPSISTEIENPAINIPMTHALLVKAMMYEEIINWQDKAITVTLN